MSTVGLATTLLPAGAASLAAEGSIGAAALRGELDLNGFRLARSAAEIQAPDGGLERSERSALAARLEMCLAPLRPHVAVLDAVRALRENASCVVVAGQQPGLLASPLLTLYKALHALRLARLLAQAWERPVSALFWNHADDHDIAEVHHVHFLNENLDLQRLSLPNLSSGRQPIGRLPLDEQGQIAGLRAVLEQALVLRSTDPERRARAQRAVQSFLPRHGETLAAAFTRALTALLGHLGLVVLEPEWIREELSRALSRLVRCDPLGRLREGSDGLRSAGFEVAIEPSEAALLYRLDPHGRQALRAAADGFRADGEARQLSPAELSGDIERDLRTWSPGALLRPLAQDMCLPVAAYVGGPNELAYHAQLGPLRRAAGVAFTPYVLRRSCTLVDPECAASLAKLGVDARTAIEGRLASALAQDSPEEPAVLADLRRAGERASEELLVQRPALERFDRALAVNLERTADQVRDLVEKLVKKGERVHQNSSGKGRRHVRRVLNTLRPNGEPQERVLGPLPFVARFGQAWIDALHAELDPFETRHLVATLTEEGESTPAGMPWPEQRGEGG